MKRTIVFLLTGVVCIGLSWAAYQATAPEEAPLSRYVPSGALLYLQAKDFSSLLAGWNASPQKQRWMKSSNYEVFSRSRLFLRLKDASSQFTTAAGIPPDGSFLLQVAGRQSVLALYDIGKLQFLYMSKLSSTSSMQTALWQTRAKFETREVSGRTFYVRRDPESEKEVAFAVNGEYLLLATREDLVAEALKLMGGSTDQSVEVEPWWSQSVAAGGVTGDLRMIMNLEKIIPSPYFRSYWIQQNITDMKQYRAAVSDLFLSGKEIREERVLMKKPAAGGEASEGNGSDSVSDLVRLVPPQAGIYEVKANPSAEVCFKLLETKILAPHPGPALAPGLAPQEHLTSGETGNISDLESRIDQAPVRSTTPLDAASPLKELFQKHKPRAILQVQSTERDRDGVFVRLHTGFAIHSELDWDEAGVRSALVDFIRPSLTAGKLGVAWMSRTGYQELDGLWTFVTAAQGRYLLIADDPALMNGMLARLNEKVALQPAVFIGGVNLTRERENFARLTGLLDRGNSVSDTFLAGGPTPQFFSDNIGSLGSTLAEMSSEKIVVRDAGEKVLQTVTYEWAR
ncbi:MAG: hypothetical protein WBN92_12475 [Terriglobia bacterium]